MTREELVLRIEGRDGGKGAGARGFFRRYPARVSVSREVLSVPHPYAIATFVLALLPLAMAPGASLTLLIQRVAEDGRTQAWPVILGTATGIYTHATLAAVGLSALVRESQRAFTAVQLGGAVFLIGLGIWTWRSAGSSAKAAAVSPCRRGPRWASSTYSKALMMNVLNPKAVSIYLTLVPQFIRAGQQFATQMLALATVHIALTALWLGGWTFLVERAAHIVRAPRFKAVLTRVTGVVFIALGVRAALS